MTLLVDAIGNIRMVNGTIRADILVIDGQNDDGQFRFKKSDEVVLSLAAFGQVFQAFSEVDKDLKERAKAQVDKSDTDTEGDT